MTELRVHLDITVSPRVLRWGLPILLVTLCAQELVSESVTLSTYYPAPSGVYTNLITTGATYLARDTGNVGIGNTSPDAKLQVVGSGTGEMRVGGECGGNYTSISVNGLAVGACGASYNLLSSPTDQTLYINRPSGATMQFRENNSTQMIIDTGGDVGIGVASPASKLDVNGFITTHPAGCRGVTYAIGWSACNAGEYVTWIDGLATPMSGGPSDSSDGYMRCCACSGSCPF